jgi:hypothetical protein
VSNTIDSYHLYTPRDYSELSVLDADVHRINVTDGATFIGPVESVNIRTDSMLANDGTFTTLVTDSVSASVITDRITSRKGLTGNRIVSDNSDDVTCEVETMDVVDVTCENIVTRELTSTAISSVVVKAESINSMECRS